MRTPLRLRAGARRRPASSVAESTAAAPATRSPPAKAPAPARPTLPARWVRLAVALLAALFVACAATSMAGDSPTNDEFVYPVEGLYYFETGDFGFNPQNPPLIKELSGLVFRAHGPRLDLDPRWRAAARYGGWEPWIFSTKFMLDNAAGYQRMFFRARWIAVAFGLATGLLVFVWSRRLWGDPGGLLAFALYVLCPNVLAHTRIVTPDMPVTFFCFACSYLFWRWTEVRTDRYALGFGLAAGLALASKFSALLLAPVLVVQYVLWRPARRGYELRALALATFAALLALGATYGFRGTFKPWSAITFGAESLRALRASLPWLRLPVPEAFLLGIDAKMVDAARGEFPGFLFGEWSANGWKSFYVLSFLLKTPLPVLAFCIAAALWWPREVAPRTRRDVLALLAPVVGFVLLSTVYFYKINNGLRYLLPLYPFLYVLCGRVAPLTLRPTPANLARALGLGWCAWSSLAVHPGYLSYMNEIIGTENGWRAFVDSNVDWGQDLLRLRQWMDRTATPSVHLAYFGHVAPEIYGITYQPLRRGETPRGIIAISATLLQGLNYGLTYERMGEVRTLRRSDFAWLRGRTPLAVVGGSILVFRNE